MAEQFRFFCRTCGDFHEGMPHLGAEAPLYVYAIPEEERGERVQLTSDTCIIDDRFFFVRGVIEIPVAGADEPFGWGVWVSLSRDNFHEYLDHWDDPHRGELGPYFGWLSANFLTYPDAENLKTMVHPRGDALRPLIELEPTEHPLSIDQREGITVERVAELYAAYVHDD